MEIGPFECKGIIISEECKELTEALLSDKLQCSMCSGRRFLVKAVVEASFVIKGGDVPIICPTGDDKIHITDVVKCSKTKCGSTTFTKG